MEHELLFLIAALFSGTLLYGQGNPSVTYDLRDGDVITAGQTGDVVFYNTTIETSDYPGYVGESLISPEGWTSSLGGESEFMDEYGTTELSGVNNLDSRAAWSTVLSEPELLDGTQITTFNFTKGDDGWNPLPALIDANPTSVRRNARVSSVKLYSAGDRVFVSNVQGTKRLKSTPAAD